MIQLQGSRATTPFLPVRHSPPIRRRLSCAHGRHVVFGSQPLIMGILNVTPDSFSDGGRYVTTEAACERGLQMAAEGADVIDIGGESTRPRAQAVSLAEELRRVLPVIRQLARQVRVPISVDTSKADVAERALDAGACLVNDVTALRGDGRMGTVVARSRAAVILMHMRGTPQTMQRQPRYHDVVQQVLAFLRQAAAQALAWGIARERLCLDPGLGFGKTARHNLQLLGALDRLMALGFPVVIGPSRKSFIGTVLQVDIPDRLAGTLACVAHAAADGVHMVRVHDVQATRQFLSMLEAIHPHTKTFGVGVNHTHASRRQY